MKIVAVTLGKKGAFVRTEKGGIIVKASLTVLLMQQEQATHFGEDFFTNWRRAEKNYANLRRRKCPNLPILGNASASVCVENYGAIPAMPTLEQVLKKQKEERQK